jgi:hypothetical protein
VVECLPSKHKVQSSNPESKIRREGRKANTIKKEKEKNLRKLFAFPG